MEIVKTEPLSENGSFEKVVNAATSKRRKKAERAKRGALLNGIHRLVFTLGFFLLGVALVSPRVVLFSLACFAMGAVACFVSFRVGKYFKA
jgi:hypothetical protein